MATGIYSTVTFGPFGEVFVRHEVIPIVEWMATLPTQPPPQPTAGPTSKEK